MTPAESWHRLNLLYAQGPDAVELTTVEQASLDEVGNLIEIFSPQNSRFAADHNRYLGVFERRTREAGQEHQPDKERVYVSRGTQDRLSSAVGPVPDHEVFIPTLAALDALVSETNFGPAGPHPDLLDFIGTLGLGEGE